MGDNPLSCIFSLTLSITSEDSMVNNSLSWIFVLTLSIASEDSMGDNLLSWIFALTSEDQWAIIPCSGFLP